MQINLALKENSSFVGQASPLGESEWGVSILRRGVPTVGKMFGMEYSLYWH